jgi:hypothetical protein
MYLIVFHHLAVLYAQAKGWQGIDALQQGIHRIEEKRHALLPALLIYFA